MNEYDGNKYTPNSQLLNPYAIGLPYTHDK